MTPHEQAADLVKVAPPVAVTTMTVAGYTMSDWVLALTAIYTLLQIFLLLRRLVVARRASDLDAACADCPSARRDK